LNSDENFNLVVYTTFSSLSKKKVRQIIYASYLLYQRKSKQRKRKEKLKENKTDLTRENKTATTFLVLEYRGI
jgi:hypothetical protein